MKASSTWPPSRTWPHGASSGSACRSITTPSSPPPPSRWPLPCAAATSPARSSTPTGAASTPPTCSPRRARGAGSASRWAGPGRASTTPPPSRSSPPWSGSCSASHRWPPSRPPAERSPVHRLVQPGPPAQLVRDEATNRLRGDPRRQSRRNRRRRGGGVKTGLQDRLRARNEIRRHQTPGDDRINQRYGALHETGGSPSRQGHAHVSELRRSPNRGTTPASALVAVASRWAASTIGGHCYGALGKGESSVGSCAICRWREGFVAASASIDRLDRHEVLSDCAGLSLAGMGHRSHAYAAGGVAAWWSLSSAGPGHRRRIAAAVGEDPVAVKHVAVGRVGAPEVGVAVFDGADAAVLGDCPC